MKCFILILVLHFFAFTLSQPSPAEQQSRIRRCIEEIRAFPDDANCRLIENMQECVDESQDETVQSEKFKDTMKHLHGKLVECSLVDAKDEHGEGNQVDKHAMLGVMGCMVGLEQSGTKDMLENVKNFLAKKAEIKDPESRARFVTMFKDQMAKIHESKEAVRIKEFQDVVKNSDIPQCIEKRKAEILEGMGEIQPEERD